MANWLKISKRQLVLLMSLQKLNYLKYRKNNPSLRFPMEGRLDTQQSHYMCKKSPQAKFNRARSQSRLSKASEDNNKRLRSYSNARLYNKLNHQLKEIKETLKSSLVKNPTSGGRKKKLPKYREKVITEISDHEPKRYKYTRNYYDVLDHIAEIKSKNKANKTSQIKHKNSAIGEEKTLFYGIDFIDSMEFKIKIKLTKTNYYLFAKNNHTKLMIEMSYADYMKLHLGELRGNPCCLFKYLQIKGERVQILLKGFTQGRSPPSLRSYVGFV